MSSSLKVRWSPHSHQRFLKINSKEHELSVHDIDIDRPRAKYRFKQVYRHSRISHIRCVDWSPTDESVVAVGQSSGESLLIQLSGNSRTALPLPVKQQRSCNSISFNSTGLLLATGLDKVRNDFCLNIWDVNQRISQVPPESLRPSRQLASSEAISSVRFTRDHAHTLVAGVAYRFIKIFDLRGRAALLRGFFDQPLTPLFLPESPSNPSIQMPSRCVHGISLDLDPNYFASHSDDGLVAVWDRRFGRTSAAGTAEPALQFDLGRGGGQILSVRHSNERQGAFAVLNSAGGLRVYETAKVSDQETIGISSLGMLGNDNGVGESSKPVRAGWRDSAANLLEAGRAYGGTSTSGTRTPNPRAIEGETLLVSRINDLESFNAPYVKHDKKIASFDWMTDGTKGGPLKIITMKNDGTIEIMACPGSVPSLAWGSMNEFLMASETGVRILKTPSTNKPVEDKPRRKSTASDVDDFDMDGKYNYSHSPDQKLGLHEKRRTERSNSIVHPDDYRIDPEELIRNDICVTMRRLVEEGYEMNCAKNAALTKDEELYPYLSDMWLWLDGARECAEDNGMISGLLDLSYIGVLGVWHGDREPTLQSRLTTGKSPGRNDWTEAVAAINRRSGRKPFKDCQTEFPEQRRLALAICNWNYDSEDFERELKMLERTGKYAKAAGWAMFKGDIDRCINSLKSGDQQMRLMSAAVAGYYAHVQSNSNVLNDTWKTLCSEFATELYDPYLRAIFAYVSDGNWRDLLEDIGLPIRERLGIAIRWLEDEELTNFLENAFNKAIKSGELESIVLTGITPKAIELLQVYIDRTGDVQTASLVASFAVPRFFNDLRVSYWVESYRQLLNSWRMFHARARFDVARGKNSRNRKGMMTMDPPQRQVYVRCANCDRSIAHNLALPTKEVKQMTHKQATATSSTITKATVCPHCRKPLPRCAVCLLNLGTASQRKVPATKNGGGGEKEVRSDEEIRKEREKEYDRWFNFCLSCNHGMHAGHARDWFQRHRVCPVPDCECACKM